MFTASQSFEGVSRALSDAAPEAAASAAPGSPRGKRWTARTLPAAAVTLAAAAAGGCGGPGLDISFNPHEATVQQLRTYVKTSFVSCRSLISRYQLLHDSLDPSLRAIVTWNEKDFPRDVLDAFGIEVQTPDEFVLNQLMLEKMTALAALKQMRQA